ncbi:MAG: hypothetical protein ACW986_17420 [Promethearchaeota archaeon]|jgi:hypothetical protein
MDIKRTKELLTNLVDQIDVEKRSINNKISEKNAIEIKIKIMAILNELDIRPLEIGLRDEY